MPSPDYFHGFAIEQKSELRYGKPQPAYTPIALIMSSSDADKTVFPVGKPVLIKSYNTRIQAAAGKTGTLPDVLDLVSSLGFFPPTIVVRIAEYNDEKEQQAAIEVALKALLLASAEYEVDPRIIGLPGLDGNEKLIPTLKKVLDDLEAVAYLSVEGKDHEAAIEAVEPYKDRRMMSIWPDFKQGDAAISAIALAVAMRSYVDYVYGPHHCLSNLAIPTDRIDAISSIVNWQTKDSIGNALNKNHITTLIRRDGQFFFWGVRTRYTADSAWIFESDVRMSDVINGIIKSRQIPNQGRPLSRSKIELILRQINADIQGRVAMEWLINGNARIDYEQNSEEVLANGGLWVYYDYSVPKPLEQMHATSVNSSRYLLEVLPDFVGAQ